MKLKNNIKDLFLYLIVGVIATLTEWLFFYMGENLLSFHYAVATVLAYILSTFVNWGAGRILVFKNSHQAVLKELLKIYLTSVVGLLLNLGIMFVSVDLLGIDEMLSKIVATAIVFFFNYLVRKLYIYKQ